jgi:hypothetical protein
MREARLERQDGSDVEPKGVAKSDGPGLRYVVVSTSTHAGAQRHALLDTHTQQVVKSYRSFLVAASDARFLNEHAAGLPAADSGSVTRSGRDRHEPLVDGRATSAVSVRQ